MKFGFAPAVVLGLLLLFFVGFGVTYGILIVVIKMGKGHPTFRSYVWKIEDWIEKISCVGGVIAVAVTVVLLFVVPENWTIAILLGLTAVGVLVGISTFFLFQLETIAHPGTQYESTDAQTRQWSRGRSVVDP